MFPNKYVEVTMAKSGQPDQRHIIMFNETVQHREAVNIIHACVKDHDLAMDVVSAGNVRLSKDGYVVYGNSLSLGCGHDKSVGPYLTQKLLEKGLDYVACGRGAIFVTQGLINHDEPQHQAGSVNVREDRTSQEIRLIYRIESIDGWFGPKGGPKNMMSSLERLLNCGNLD